MSEVGSWCNCVCKDLDDVAAVPSLCGQLKVPLFILAHAPHCSVKYSVDMIAASFVRKASDIATIRECLGRAGQHIKVRGMDV